MDKLQQWQALWCAANYSACKVDCALWSFRLAPPPGKAASEWFAELGRKEGGVGFEKTSKDALGQGLVNKPCLFGMCASADNVCAQRVVRASLFALLHVGATQVPRCLPSYVTM